MAQPTALRARASHFGGPEALSLEEFTRNSPVAERFGYG